MNKIIIQLWEITMKQEIYSDGCSIHLDDIFYESFISNINSLERKMGKPFTAFVSDSIYNKLISYKSLRFSETELNNLLTFEEIIIKND